MKLPGDLYMSDTKVIESKTVCYCSNFDLNVNEWFNEYENIEIFKINVNKNLGKFFFFYFRLLIYMGYPYPWYWLILRYLTFLV